LVERTASINTMISKAERKYNPIQWHNKLLQSSNIVPSNSVRKYFSQKQALVDTMCTHIKPDSFYMDTALLYRIRHHIYRMNVNQCIHCNLLKSCVSITTGLIIVCIYCSTSHIHISHADVNTAEVITSQTYDE